MKRGKPGVVKPVKTSGEVGDPEWSNLTDDAGVIKVQAMFPGLDYKTALNLFNEICSQARDKRDAEALSVTSYNNDESTADETWIYTGYNGEWKAVDISEPPF